MEKHQGWLDQRECSAPPRMSAKWRLGFALAGATPLIRHAQQQAECNWLAQHEPALWRNTAKFLFLSGWLSHRMTGEFVDSSGSQVGYVPFDYRRQQWAAASDFKWQAFAITPTQLPRLVAPGQPMGALTAHAAAALGLPVSLPVIAAGTAEAQSRTAGCRYPVCMPTHWAAPTSTRAALLVPSFTLRLSPGRTSAASNWALWRTSSGSTPSSPSATSAARAGSGQ